MPGVSGSYAVMQWVGREREIGMERKKERVSERERGGGRGREIDRVVRVRERERWGEKERGRER